MNEPNRNDPCSCGSGKKYKKCCLNKTVASKNAAKLSVQSPGNEINSRNISPPSKLLLQAVALHQSGKLDEAQVIYQSLLKTNPQDCDALHYLGLIAFQKGGYADAAHLIVAAIKLNNRIPAYHCNLGNAYKRMGQLDAAIAAYQQAVLLDPGFEVAYSNMGNAFKDQAKLADAIESYRKALALKPDFHVGYYNLGVAYMEQGRLVDAGDCYQKAIKLKPDYADAHVNLVEVYISMNQFEAAQLALSNALQYVPKHPGVWALFPQLRKMTLADDDWLKTALAFVSGDNSTRDNSALSENETMNLLFAIGKYYDDTQQYDLAFSAYAQANTLKSQVLASFDRDDFSKTIDMLIATYTADFISQPREGKNPSPRPVIIAGMPRSGTTLTEQIIAAHPDAFGAGELTFWLDLYNENRKAALRGGYEPAEIRKIASGYEQCLQYHSAAAIRVVDKAILNFCFVGLITTVFPNAKIIFTQRNPVDICLSIYFQNFKTTIPYQSNLEDMAFYYREYARLVQHWRVALPADRFLEVPYEALLDDQEGWSKRIIEFIGLPWDARCLEFHKTERNVMTASKWQVRQKIYHTSKGRWRNYEKYLGPLLELLELPQK